MRPGLPRMTALLYIICCSVVLRRRRVDGLGGGFHSEALKTSGLALSFAAGFQTQWLCSPREKKTLRYQRDINEKFHFQSSGFYLHDCLVHSQVKSNCINLTHTVYSDESFECCSQWPSWRLETMG